MDILAILAIVVMITYIVISFKKSVQKDSATLAQTVANNANYNGVRKSVAIKNCSTIKTNALISVIKCIREASGMSLADVKKIVLGNGIIESLPIEVAEKLVLDLASLGVLAELQ